MKRVLIIVGAIIGGIIVLNALSELNRGVSTSAPSSSDRIRAVAQKIGTDCRMTMRAPNGRTSQDAIDGFAALRAGDRDGLKALMASGRVGAFPEGTRVRVLSAEGAGNIAIKVRVLEGWQLGEEAWVFEGACK